MYRPRPRMSFLPAPRTRRIIIILGMVLVALAYQEASADSVDARLSTSTIGAGQPAQLTLTATSSGSGQGLSPPDLSVLNDGFQILDRKTQRRLSVHNGHRQEQVTLRLLLMPKGSGSIHIPPIAFGDAKSAPLTLTVEGNADRQPDDAASSHPGQDQGPASPDSQADRSGRTPWDLAGQGRGMQSRWASEWPSAPWPGNPFAPPGGGDKPQPVELPRFDLPRNDHEQTPASRAAAAKDDGRSPWFWVSLILALALVVALVKRRTPTPTMPGQPAAAAAEAPPDPLTLAVERVREAYRRGDAASARDSLLKWAGLNWPQNPPNNLSRLAQRLQPPLRDHVTDLEKAFFSPTPIQWDLDPVADELAALSKAGPVSA